MCDVNLLDKENLAQPIYIVGGGIYWGAVDKVCKDSEYQLKRENLCPVDLKFLLSPKPSEVAKGVFFSPILKGKYRKKGVGGPDHTASKSS